GCWETVASGSAITREGRAAARRHAPLAARAGGDPGAVTGPIVGDAARDGGAVARGIVEEAGRRRGRGVAGVGDALGPAPACAARGVGGGGVAGAGALLLEPARRAFLETVEGAAYRPDVPIVEAALGVDSVAIGAALLALDAS